MLLTVYEKWEELKKQYQTCVGDQIVTSYYLGGNSKAKIYFSVLNMQLGIYLEFDKNNLKSLDVPCLKGMKISVCEASFLDVQKEYIYIENVSQEEEIFEAFSGSLTDELFESKTDFDTYEALIKTVKKYKAYFSNSNTILTKIEEQGLCAELTELCKLIKVKGQEVVKNWLGPAKNKRDFVFENVSLEIKSTQSQSNTTITISNENQLDSNYPCKMESLFLKVYLMEDREEGINVNTCIDAVLNELQNVTYKKIFISNLTKLGINLDEYKSRFNFSIEKEILYLVNDEFPKIIKGNIPNSIHDVSYKLNVSSLGEFMVEEGEMYERLQ